MFFRRIRSWIQEKKQDTKVNKNGRRQYNKSATKTSTTLTSLPSMSYSDKYKQLNQTFDALEVNFK